MSKRRLERGQALVLIVLAIVAMFGFAALAVDIGRLYAERRRVQSAADSAALAAAFAASQSDDYEAAALTQLRMNDIFDTDPLRNADSRIDVEVYHPPVSGAYGPDSGRTEEDRNQYYQVIIHSAVDQVFSQFIYQGPMAITAEAVGHVLEAGGGSGSAVMRALAPNECDGIRFTGDGETVLHGGNAISDSRRGNGCLNDDGEVESGEPASCSSTTLSGNGTVTIIGGGLNTGGAYIDNGNGTITADGGINTCQPPDPMASIPRPDCSHLEHRTYNGGNATLQPGIYDSGIIVHGNKTRLHLEPGMYCLNGDLSMNGGEILGEGVMFFVENGNVELVGNTIVNLQAAGGTSLKDAKEQEWSGMLIYMPKENDGVVHIGGGSGSRYSGMIYAPGPRTPSTQDKCIIEGSGTSLGMASSLICYTIKIAGTANVTIFYDEDQNYQLPATIDLAQ